MRLAALLLAAACFVPFVVVRAADGEISRTVTETRDYFVVVTEPTLFTARTLLCDEPAVLWCARPEQGGHFVDSALWVYDTEGLMIGVSDDDGVSYASLIQISLQPGFYRLRAGRYGPCNSAGCMHPEEPFPVGGFYELLTNLPLLLDPTPPVASPPPIPSELPSPEPSPTQTPEEPSPSPSVAPTPTPEASTTPPPTPEPTPEPPPTPEPTPEPTPTPTAPPPTVAPTQEPTNEPPPIPTATPQPTPEGTVEPSPPASPPPSADPTPLPPPEPTQPPLPTVEEVAAAVEEAVAAAAEVVGESVAAIGGGIADIAAIGEIGKDLDATEKEEVQPVAVAVVSSQIASVAAAAANATRTGGGSTPSGGNLGGGGGGGTDAPKTRKTSSRKEPK